MVKINQITAVVEYSDTGSEDHGTWQRIPNEDATVYGLGDDGKLYTWGVTKSVLVTNDEPDEDGDTSYYRKEYGWRIVN